MYVDKGMSLSNVCTVLYRYCSADDNLVGMEQELDVLIGVIDRVLPQVGHHVSTLDLSHGKAVTNEIVNIIIIAIMTLRL